MTAYTFLHGFDTIDLPRTCPASSTDINDGYLGITGNVMCRIDCLSDVKRGRVYSYHKNNVFLKIIFRNVLILKYSSITANANFLIPYRFPSQSQNGYNDFFTDLAMNLDNFFPRNLFLAAVIGLYVLIMSFMRFRVNPHSIVAWMSRDILLEAGAKSEV